MKLKRSGILIKIVLAVLLCCAVARLISLNSQIDVAQTARNALLGEVEAKTAANAQKAYAVENSGSDEIIADVARDELGLVGDNEQVYYGS